MLFSEDIETEGWENVITCYPLLKRSTYYCISHHGSITGHFRHDCAAFWVNPHIKTLAECAASTKLQILMGRDCAYNGIFNSRVISDFRNLLKIEDAKHYIEIEWDSDTYKFY